MASIKLRKNTWYAVWYENGRHVMKTTNIKAKGDKERKLAQTTADTLEQAARGNIPLQQAMGAIRKLACTLGMKQAIPTIKDYLTNHKPCGSDSHRSNARRAFKMFLEFLDADAYLPLDMLTVKHCREFIEAQLNRVAVGTVKTYKSSLQTAFQIAMEDELIERNPFSLVTFKRLSGKYDSTVIKRQPFTMQEIHTIIKHAVYPWKQIVMLCILTGGQRLGDIVCMKWSQIHWRERFIVIKTMKTGKNLITPLTNALESLLKPLYCQSEEYIFPDAATRYSRSKGCLSAEFVSLLKVLGIINLSNIHTGAGDRKISDKSFHSLRHSVVSMLRVNPSFTSDLIRETVGHDCEEVERGYFSPSIEAKRSVIDFLAQQITPTV